MDRCLLTTSTSLDNLNVEAELYIFDEPNVLSVKQTWRLLTSSVNPVGLFAWYYPFWAIVIDYWRRIRRVFVHGFYYNVHKTLKLSKKSKTVPRQTFYCLCLTSALDGTFTRVPSSLWTCSPHLDVQR